MEQVEVNWLGGNILTPLTATANEYAVDQGTHDPATYEQISSLDISSLNVSNAGI